MSTARMYQLVRDNQHDNTLPAELLAAWKESDIQTKHSLPGTKEPVVKEPAAKAQNTNAKAQMFVAKAHDETLPAELLKIWKESCEQTKRSCSR